jgi:hypothetical protein
VARAQPEQPSAVAEAKREFLAGERAFEQNDPSEALGHFRRAFELEPHDVVRFNIAVCLERMGRFVEAVREYDAAAASSMLDEAGRERARREAVRARKKLAVLVVDGSPRGAAVSVDGRRACVLPCRTEVDPGVHEVAVRHRGGEFSTRVELASGQTRTVRAEIAAPRPSRTAPPSREPDRAQPERRGPSFLTWLGGGIAVAGAGGATAFWIRANDLQEQYDADPSRDTRDEGLRMVTFTNVALGVAAAGAALVAFDLLVLAPREVEPANQRKP